VHAISRQLHPSILEDLGLEDAVRNEINAFHRREGIHIDYLSSGIPDKLPKDVSLCFFRIIQESLRNIAKHARTNSASITLTGSTDHLDMDIRDHGCGFDQENTRKQLGLGLISIGERVRMVDGKLEITSSPGQGTRIQVSAPIAAEGKR
jgi:signal transduction histidine kinase